MPPIYAAAELSSKISAGHVFEFILLPDKVFEFAIVYKDAFAYLVKRQTLSVVCPERIRADINEHWLPWERLSGKNHLCETKLKTTTSVNSAFSGSARAS